MVEERLIIASEEALQTLGPNEWQTRMMREILQNGAEDHRIADAGTPEAVVAQTKGSARLYPTESRRAVRARQYGPSIA